MNTIKKFKITKSEARWVWEYHGEKADEANFHAMRQRKLPSYEFPIPIEDWKKNRTYHRARARQWKKHYEELKWKDHS